MEDTKNKLMILGDLHLKSTLSYNDYVKGGREAERKEIFDFIINQSKDCDNIVMLGDQLNSRTNPPEIIRMLVEFIEKFSSKNIYIIKGNHEQLPSDKSAIDFLKEVKNDRWHIITNQIESFKIDNFNCIFLPYFTKQELEASSHKQAAEIILEKLPKADILFHHHTMSVKGRVAGLKLDAKQMSELVLPVERLKEKYSLIFSGHIHNPSIAAENAFVVGSVFTDEVGETDRYIFKIDTSVKDIQTLTDSIEQIKLPGRGIFRIENPKIEDLVFPANSIVKAVITQKITAEKIEELKQALSEKFNGYIFVENIPSERKKIHLDKSANMLEFSIPQLLEIYSKEKKVSLELLQRGYEIIRQ